MWICGIALLRVAPFAEMVKHGIAALRKPAITEMWKGDLRLPPLMICAGYLAGQASDRWNRSILPMQGIGKTPVNIHCIVMLGKLPGCHVRETCVSGASWKPVGCWWRRARSRRLACGAAGQTPARQWRWSCLKAWDNAAERWRGPWLGTFLVIYVAESDLVIQIQRRLGRDGNRSKMAEGMNSQRAEGDPLRQQVLMLILLMGRAVSSLPGGERLSTNDPPR